MDPYLASGLGFIVGALAVSGFIWWSLRKRPDWHFETRRRDTALTMTIVGLAFALFSFPVGSTYFLLWMFYGIALGFIGYGVVTAVLIRKEPVDEPSKRSKK